MLFASRFASAIRGCSAVLAVISLLTPALPAQAPPASLQITILDGDEAMNNIRQRTAREPIVQVEDENHKPVAGAVVIFLLPNDGAGGTFAGGARTLTVTTDSKGQAVARGLRPNNLSGRFQIRVQASYQGKTAQANINQTNEAGTAGNKSSSSSSALPKWLAILAAGAVTAVAVSVANRGNTPPSASSVPVAVIPGTGSVGAPH
jgi:hypothetical protein